MRIIITDGWMARNQPLFVETPKALLALLAGVVCVSALSIGAYHAWGRLQGGGLSSEAQERFVHENINVMAKKVGEMQAQLIQLEALAMRVSSRVKPVEPAGGKPAQPGSSPTGGTAPVSAADTKVLGQAGVPSGSAEPVSATGRGGLLEQNRPLTADELLRALDALEQDIQEKTDMFHLSEAILSERKLSTMTVPSEHPVPGMRIGSRFGWRIDPINGHRALHAGLDFAAPTGTAIHAAAGGVVIRQEVYAGYGEVVEIDHGSNLVTRYAHTSKQYVKVGDLVKKGQHIADVGSTGRSTGPHLHFEVLVDEVRVDPMLFLRESITAADASAIKEGEVASSTTSAATPKNN